MVPWTRVCESDIRVLANAFRLSGWGLPPVQSRLSAQASHRNLADPPTGRRRRRRREGGPLRGRGGEHPGGLSWCQAASTSSLLTWGFPALVIPPLLADSPLEDSGGTSPTRDMRALAERKRDRSPHSTATEKAVGAGTPPTSLLMFTKK